MDSPSTNVDVSPAAPTARKPFQYSLRTLLELTAVAGLGCSLWAWGGEALSRTPEFFLGLAVVLIVVSFYIRRWTWFLGGLVVVGGMLYGLNIHQEKVTRDAHYTWRNYQLTLTVVDAQSYAYIPNATLKITSGKPSARKTEIMQTSTNGGVVVETTAWVRVTYDKWELERADNGIEIQVSAAGYKTRRGRYSDFFNNESNGSIIELYR